MQEQFGGRLNAPGERKMKVPKQQLEGGNRAGFAGLWRWCVGCAGTRGHAGQPTGGGAGRFDCGGRTGREKMGIRMSRDGALGSSAIWPCPGPGRGWQGRLRRSPGSNVALCHREVGHAVQVPWTRKMSMVWIPVAERGSCARSQGCSGAAQCSSSISSSHSCL